MCMVNMAPAVAATLCVLLLYADFLTAGTVVNTNIKYGGISNMSDPQPPCNLLADVTLLSAAMRNLNLKTAWLPVRINRQPTWRWVGTFKPVDTDSLLPDVHNASGCAAARFTQYNFVDLSCFQPKIQALCEKKLCGACQTKRFPIRDCRRFGDRCFYEKPAKNWYHAQEKCLHSGGYLAILSDPELRRKVFESGLYSSGARTMWVGLNRDELEGTKLPVNQFAAAKDPLNPPTGKCIVAKKGRKGAPLSWHVVACDESHPLFCDTSVVPAAEEITDEEKNPNSGRMHLSDPFLLLGLLYSSFRKIG